MLLRICLALYALTLTAACEQLEALQPLQTVPSPQAQITADEGYALLDQKQTAAALTLFNRAVVMDSNNVRALQGQGIALNQQGRHKEADLAYKKALTISPDSVSVANNLAMSYMLQKSYGDAIALLEPLHEKNPSDTKINDNLALAHCLSGKLEDARKLYSKTLKPKEVDENLKFCGKMGR